MKISFHKLSMKKNQLKNWKGKHVKVNGVEIPFDRNNTLCRYCNMQVETFKHLIKKCRKQNKKTIKQLKIIKDECRKHNLPFTEKTLLIDNRLKIHTERLIKTMDLY